MGRKSAAVSHTGLHYYWVGLRCHGTNEKSLLLSVLLWAPEGGCESSKQTMTIPFSPHFL